MASQENINESFNCRRLSEDGLVIVTNSLSYTMAEYNDNTGITRWQRVVSAAQKEHVQDWLLKHYPVKTQAAAAPAPTKRRTSSAS